MSQEGKKQIMPQDLVAVTGSERIMIKVDMSITRKLKMPVKETRNIKGMLVPYEHSDVDQVFKSVACEFPRHPVPAPKVNEALNSLVVAIKQELQKAGLMR